MQTASKERSKNSNQLPLKFTQAQYKPPNRKKLFPLAVGVQKKSNKNVARSSSLCPRALNVKF